MDFIGVLESDRWSDLNRTRDRTDFRSSIFEFSPFFKRE